MNKRGPFFFTFDQLRKADSVCHRAQRRLKGTCIWAGGSALLHIFTKTGSGQQHHVIKLNVHVVCAISVQEITLIRKEGKLHHDVYEERLESLQGTVVPEYRGKCPFGKSLCLFLSPDRTE